MGNLPIRNMHMVRVLLIEERKKDGGSSMQKELNPKFPYNIKRAHRYLMFLYMEQILTGEEFDRAMKRLNKQTGTTWCDLI
jgi:hypothetical protein